MKQNSDGSRLFTNKYTLLFSLIFFMISLKGFTQTNCTTGGININVTGSFTYSAGYEPPFGPFPPATVCTQITAPYTGVGRGTGNLAGGLLIYTFSKPVTSATVSYSAVTTDDVATVTINGCGTPTLSSSCRFNVEGNIVSCNNGFYGDAVLTVTSGGLPFTSITITNVNNASGIVMGNPCNFLLTPYVCSISTTPALSTLSLTNICPSLTVNLNSITASNTPSCSTLTWHTSTPATNLNLVSNPNTVTTGTYYASFLVGGTTTCFGPTKAVTVNTFGCNSDLSVTKNISNLTPSVGSNVTFTIVVTNNGTDNANNVVAVDNLLSGYTFVSASTSSGSWNAPNWNIGNLNNGASATLSLIATVKPTGNYSNSVSVSSNQADINLSNNLASVTPNVIYAVNDNFSANSLNDISSCEGGSSTSVFSNDLLNNNPVAAANVNVFLIAPLPIAGATINSNGIITIPSNVPAGIYNFTYQICQSSLPSNCTTAIATIKVVDSPIFANDDNFSTTLISSIAGGSTSSNVLSNDTLNGVVATSSNVTTVIVSSSPSIPFLTISSEGIITVPPGVTSGSYTITYSIAQIGCASNISYGTVIIVIGDSEVTQDIVPGIRANKVVSLVDTQTSNKIIIAGYFSSYNNIATSCIAKLNDNLTLDTSGFNTSGPIFGSGIKVPWDMKVIKNSLNLNKILLVGGFLGFNGSYSNGVGIARLLANGNIDTSFNSGPISGGATRGVSGSNSEIRTLYVYPDDAILGNAGKILIGGMFKFYNGVAREKIARLNPDGSLDMTFNPNNGAVYKPELGNIAGFETTPQAIVVQSDGRIVVGGFFRLFNGYRKNGVLRLNNDGSIDNSFNNSYINSGNPNPGLDSGHVQKIVLQPDNKIIIGGSFTRYNNQGRNSIARLGINGELDFTFDPGAGFFPTYNQPSGIEPPGMVRSMVFDTNALGEQKLYVSGDFTKFNGANCDEVIRLFCNSTTVTNGTKDNSFGLSGGGPNGFVWSMKKQGEKIITGGQFTTYDIYSALNVTRILPTSNSSELRGSVVFYGSEPEIDIFSNTEIIIYPNPTTGIINLSRANATKDLIVEVYTILGQKVFEKVNLITENTLDLSHLNKGTYFIKFGDGNQKVTKTIIIR